MTGTSKKYLLAQIKNGVKTPLYFDRQVIRAEDLTLDRTSHDRELARMRRMLHGWGVVAGFVLTAHDNSFTVPIGYGITQTGDEVYLTEALTITDVLQHVKQCCASVKAGCEETSLKKVKASESASETEELSAWIVARAVQSKESPRAGVAQGCSHSGNNLLPSRACEIVSIELLCKLPDENSDKKTQSFSYSNALTMLPMSAEPSAEDNYLVLGKVSIGPKGIYVTAEGRRTVLPVSVLQDWLQSCKCRGSIVSQEPELKPAPETEPDKQLDGSKQDKHWNKDWQRAPDKSLPEFREVLVANGYRNDKPISKRDIAPRVPELLKDPNVLEQLEKANITSIQQLLNSDHATLAKALHTSNTEAERLMAEVKPLGVFLTGQGF